MGKWVIILFIQFRAISAFALASDKDACDILDITSNHNSALTTLPDRENFFTTSDFLDAAINSLNSFNSLLKKRSLPY